MYNIFLTGCLNKRVTCKSDVSLFKVIYSLTKTKIMKKICTFLMLSMIVLLSVKGQIPTNGLVGYWPFDGNANDASGNGNNGTVYGATLATDRFGNANSAYSFNGVDNYIIVNSSLTFPSTAITTAFWFNRNGIKQTGLENYISKELSFSTYLYADSTLVSQVWKGSPGIWSGWGSGSYKVPMNNNWIFYASTFDNTTRIVNIYVNGILVNSINETDPNAIVRTSSNSLYIGRNGSSSVYYIKGSLDDLRIYNRALSNQEIQSLFYEGICKQSITVTDTLIIKANLTGFNPIAYSNVLKVYPNPSKSSITIDCGSNYSTLVGYSFKITNSQGQSVYESLVNKQITSINLNLWSGKGLYLINLIDSKNNIVESKKIIIQ